MRDAYSELTKQGIRDGLPKLPPVLPSVPPTTMLSEIVAHLGAALVAALPSDDQIIIGHVRSAHELARLLLRATREAQQERAA